MSKEIESILDICLDEIRKGKSIEYCLSLYPEYASELEPLLRLAKDVEETPKIEPRKEAINLTLIKIGEAAVAQREKKGLHKKFFSPSYVWKPALAKAMVFAFGFLVVIWGMGAISTRSLPGNLLYPVKLTTEKVRITLTRSPEGKAELRLTLADRRLEELLKTFEKTGNLNESLLRNMLKEAELALDEAKPVEEKQFKLFLTKLDHRNAYQQAILEQLKDRVPKQEREAIEKAIEMCHQRSSCMMDMMHQGQHKMRNREWRSGCRFR